MTMMTLGMFVFQRSSVPYQELNRQTDWRHASNARLGARPVRQYIGPGDDNITLSGELRPEITGGSMSLDALRAMGDTGKAYVLIDGTGRLYGLYEVDSLSETQREFFEDGTPRAIRFSLALRRSDAGIVDNLGNLAETHNGRLS
ncbi:phage P2 GpU protein [Alcanivorax sp. S71-1-4]|uniref:phage tail protein n=1 Tax=Alcanivorax sp. S71-1-4 TaxID=1177159 RepID=UPI0016BA6687|nr:phage tail protein [Alcanivorax sp. S71-1-4]KAF0810425.1 phage P2 GpU protein [Alcanivorax sp. S71-1-4]